MLNKGYIISPIYITRDINFDSVLNAKEVVTWSICMPFHFCSCSKNLNVDQKWFWDNLKADQKWISERMDQKWDGMHMLHVTTSFTCKTGSKCILPRTRLLNLTLYYGQSLKNTVKLTGNPGQQAINRYKRLFLPLNNSGRGVSMIMRFNMWTSYYLSLRI